MYKIYFDNRFITLSDEPDRLQKYDLFHKFINTAELYNLISGFQTSAAIQNINIYSGNIKHLWKIFRIYFSETPAAGGFVRHSSGRHLFIEKRGRLDLPKGHKEPDENAESCAMREVAEECGLSGHYIIKPLRTTFHTYTAEGVLHLKKTSWFLMGYDGDMTAIPQAEEGITNVLWLLPDEFGSMKNTIWPSLMDVLNPFMANAQNLL
ncbi:MAG: NUDIX domain-containing protein [Bacteroidales bacterium]|jgi:8-oxo-dGTP pyrophosphatase MutT (NUDIX family)|nr:NUDIX domain-containing protein [Bacteroidales bacterium]